MVHTGFRKKLSGDLVAQMASVQVGEAERWAKLDSQRFRRSVCWFDSKGGIWCEIEYTYGATISVKWSFHATRPERYIGNWSGPCAEAGETLRLESGFVADGLFHLVWVGGRLVKDQLKARAFSQLIVNFHKVPVVLYELFQVRVSIPSIQESYLQYMRDAAAVAEAEADGAEVVEAKERV